MSFLISTHRLLLRQVRLEDLDVIFALLHQDSVSRWLPQLQFTYEKTELLLTEAQKNYVVATEKPRDIVQVCIEKGTNRFVGIAAMTGFGPIQGEIVMIAIMFEDEWNKGFATEAIQALSHCALSRFRFQYLTTFVDITNIGGNRVAQKCGFKQMSIVSGKDVGFQHDSPHYYYRLYNL